MKGHENCDLVDKAFAQVTCDRCKKTYVCTPQSDLYCTREGDHSCEACLLAGIGATEMIVVGRYDLKCQHCEKPIRELNGFHEDAEGFTYCRKDLPHKPMPVVKP